jgi:hypothetical protein
MSICNLTLIQGNDYHSGAAFSDDRVYRYRLWRIWDRSKDLACWVMLNPSTADEFELDPTCRRVDGFTRRWGYGGWYVGNIFALRSTDPRELYRHQEPVGPDNDRAILEMATESQIVIAAWGNHGRYQGRGRQMMKLLAGHDVHVLGKTKGGDPRHPLYIRGDSELLPIYAV